MTSKPNGLASVWADRTEICKPIRRQIEEASSR